MPRYRIRRPLGRAALYSVVVAALTWCSAAASGVSAAATVPATRQFGPAMPVVSWAWPVAAPHAVERPFIAPASTYSAGHRGIDIRAPVDGLIRAPADGVVHFAGVVVDRPVLSIEHAGDVLSSYEPVATELVAGDVVRRGDVIGHVIPGHCADTCLHFGVRVHGAYVSPLLFLGGVPRAILYPARGPPPAHARG